MGAPTHASACFHQESARNLLQYCFIWAAAYIRECVAGMGFGSGLAVHSATDRRAPRSA
jgi:hypothetical protein